MKIIFMGTPEFASHFLSYLAESSHEVVAVVTQPDRPAGRGKTITPPPVKILAEKLGLPVIQPENLKDPEFESTLLKYNADIFIVVAFSILPKKILGASRYGALNIHGSLLPAYRGAAPVQWAIANGEPQTGVTIFLLDEKMDHGPILEQREVKIDDDDTTESILNKMVLPACNGLEEALKKIEVHSSEVIEQNHEKATAAPKLKKEDGLLDFQKSALELHNRIRGFSPWPGGYSNLQGKKVYLRKTRVFEDSIKLNPGHLLIEKNHLLVGTKSGVLEILEIQTEGKKSMPASDYIKGLHQREGLLFCS